MVQPIDQGAILRSGRALIPDYAEQALQEQLLAIRQQEANTGQQAIGARISQQQRENERQDALGAALSQLGDQPSAAQIAEIMFRFPEFGEQIERGWQTMDEGQRASDFQAMAEIHDAARGGNYALAARLVRTRVEADQAAGTEPDPVDQAILSGLESADPGQQRFALDVLERTVARLAGADHYASVYGTFSRDVKEFNGILYDGNTGEPLFQDPRGRIIPGQDGAFYRLNPIEGIPAIGGGDVATGAEGAVTAPATEGATTTARETAPQLGSFDRPSAVSLANRYGRVTSTERTPEHNREVGGVRNSFHLARNGARAIDIARRRGVSHAQIVSAYQRDGYTLHPDTRDEGDHSHIVIASGPGASVPRVRSRQEYDRLPSGAQYIAPDGTMRTKS